MPFLVEKTTGDFQKVFIAFLEQEAELQEKWKNKQKNGSICFG